MNIFKADVQFLALSGLRVQMMVGNTRWVPDKCVAHQRVDLFPL